MHRATAVALATLLAVLAVVASAPLVTASHGAEANYTVQPLDRKPGLSDASYKQYAVANVSIAKIDYTVGVYREGGFTGCGASNSEVFAIDRNNDEPGMKHDESLKTHIESTTVTEHRFVADFYDSDDFAGSTTNIDAGDQFVSYTTNCLDNPDDPGWYQLYSKINGTTDGGKVVSGGRSHYFYICDCSSREEARRQLGPPPSAESTPTPSSTATATRKSTPAPTRTPPAEGTPFPSPTPSPTPAPGSPTSPDEPTPTDASSGGSGGDGGNAGDGGRAGDGGSAAGDGSRPAGTATAADWDEYVRETPTVAGGPGFTAVLALVALLAGSLLAARR